MQRARAAHAAASGAHLVADVARALDEVRPGRRPARGRQRRQHRLAHILRSRETLGLGLSLGRAASTALRASCAAVQRLFISPVMSVPCPSARPTRLNPR